MDRSWTLIQHLANECPGAPIEWSATVLTHGHNRTRAWLLMVVLGALAAAAVDRGQPAPPITGPPGSDTAASSSELAHLPGASAGPPSDSALPPCQDRIQSMSLRARLAQLLMIGIDSTDSAQARQAVATDRVGGVFVGGDATAPLTGDGLARLLSGVDIPVAVSVDEEGGRVQRIDELDGPIPSARVMARTMLPEQVRQLAAERGVALRSRGVTVDFAPVVDIGDQPDKGVIGDRSFSADPAVAQRYADAFARGLRESGVLPVVKHFPGHGRAPGDSHRQTVTAPPLDDLRGADLVPYRQLLGTAPVAVMVGHVVVPGLTDGVPASLSPATYRLLRGEYAFSGLAITDDLGSMRAISDRYRLPEAVLQALRAGADVAFWSSGRQLHETLDHLENAVANRQLSTDRISESLRRVLAAKSVCAG